VGHRGIVCPPRPHPELPHPSSSPPPSCAHTHTLTLAHMRTYTHTRVSLPTPAPTCGRTRCGTQCAAARAPRSRCARPSSASHLPRHRPGSPPPASPSPMRPAAPRFAGCALSPARMCPVCYLRLSARLLSCWPPPTQTQLHCLYPQAHTNMCAHKFSQTLSAREGKGEGVLGHLCTFIERFL